MWLWPGKYEPDSTDYVSSLGFCVKKHDSITIMPLKHNFCCCNAKDETVDRWQHISATKLMKRTRSATEGTVSEIPVCKVESF